MRVRLSIVLCIAAALTLGGCSGDDVSDVPVEASTGATPEESGEPAGNPVADQPCSAFTGEELAVVFGIADLGPLTEIEYYDGSGFPSCSWIFPPGGQERVGVSSDHQLEPNLTLIVGGYNVAGAIEGMNIRHTDAGFVEDYVASNQEQVGSNEIPIFIPGIGLGAAEDNGSFRLAINEEYWAEMTLWQVSDHEMHLKLSELALALVGEFD